MTDHIHQNHHNLYKYSLVLPRNRSIFPAANGLPTGIYLSLPFIPSAAETLEFCITLGHPFRQTQDHRTPPPPPSSARLFVGRAASHTELLALRQQGAVLKRKRSRPSLRMSDGINGRDRCYNRAVDTLCRDCGHQPPPDAETCPACGSARVVRHKELHGLAIAHLDCDAFYAAIEKRDRPELRDVPVIVGGRHRGVVSACCYIARSYGVHSAMPMFQALKACPDATVVKPDMKKYAAVGREVRSMMLDLTPLVEPLSIDEVIHGSQRHRVASWRQPGHYPGGADAPGGGGAFHHRLDRARLQQVPGQDRLRPGQAAGFRSNRPDRGHGLFSPASRSACCGGWARPCNGASPGMASR